MAGVNRNEGSLLAFFVFPTIIGNLTEKDFKKLVSVTKSMFHNVNEERVFDFYTKNADKNDSLVLRKAFYDYYGDILLKCPTYLFAKSFAEKTPHRKTYFYELTYQGKFAALTGCQEDTMGICHGSEVEFVFGSDLLLQNQTSKLDIDLSREVVKMWTNFAKTGYYFKSF